MPKGRKNVQETVEEVKLETAQAVEELRAEVGKAVEEVKPVVKRAVKATRQTAEKAKLAAQKAVAGEASVVYVQYQGAEVKVDDLLAAAKAAFAAEHPRTKVTGIRLYVKPEEHAAYYVVNEKFAGRVEF